MVLVSFSSSALFPQLVVIFPVAVPESPSLIPRTSIQQVQRAEGTWASNIPQKTSNKLQDGSCESFSFSQGSDYNTCLPPNSTLEENESSFTNSFLTEKSLEVSIY